MDSTHQQCPYYDRKLFFDTFLLKHIHIYTYFVKKQDSYKIFRLSMKISWEPGSQVHWHYPTLCSAYPAYY